MTSATQRPTVRLGSEVVLIAVLLVAWVVTWLSVDRALQSLTPAGRALFLVNQFTSESLGVALILGILAVCALPLRHRSPVAALVIVGAFAIVLEWFYPLLIASGIVIRLAVGVVMVWTTWKIRNWWWWVAAVLVPLLIVTGIRAFQTNERFEAINSTPSSTTQSISAILQEMLFFAVVVIGGLAIRRIGEQRAELEERNRELVAERARASQAAVLDERLRISRELHDVVAHHVTTMTVHAGAARQVVETSPEQATESLLHIESAGRNAVSELHQLLGFLRNSDSSDTSEDRSPTPSLRHLEDLKTTFGSKLKCVVDVNGDLANVPSAVDVSAYRIIQEALTNTLKHSTAAEVEITLDVDDAALTLRVENDGESTTDGSAHGGHGLVGMRERASLHGGELTAGPRESGSGWLVHAVLPFGGMT